jgi:hypothetical protein
MDKGRIIRLLQRRVCSKLVDFNVTDHNSVVILFSTSFSDQEYDRVFFYLKHMNLGIRWCTRATIHKDVFDGEVEVIRKRKLLSALIENTKQLEFE